MDIIHQSKKKISLLDSSQDNEVFFSILDLLMDECYKIYNGKRGFWSNRENLLTHFINKRFYVLYIEETDEIEERRNDMDKLRVIIQPSLSPFFNLIRYPNYVIPAFCCLNDDKSCDMIWVHPMFRRKGLASIFVKYFNFKHVHHIIEESKSFWDSLKVTYDICGSNPTFTVILPVKEMTKVKDDINDTRAKLIDVKSILPNNEKESLKETNNSQPDCCKKRCLNPCNKTTRKNNCRKKKKMNK